MSSGKSTDNRNILILLGDGHELQRPIIEENTKDIPNTEIVGDGVSKIFLHELNDKKADLAVLAAHGEVLNRNTKEKPSNNELHYVDGLIDGFKYSHELVRAVQQKTQAKDFLFDSCNGAAILSGFMRDFAHYEQDTQMIVFASSKYKTFLSKGIENIADVAARYSRDESLKQIFIENISKQAQSILFANKINDKEFLVLKSVSPKTPEQIEKLDLKNPETFKEYWRNESTKKLVKDENGKFSWQPITIEIPDFELTEQEAKEYLDKCFFEAADRNQLQRAKAFIKKGANINRINSSDKSAFFVACEDGYIEIVKMFIENSVDLDRVDAYNQTPLYAFCQNGNSEIVKILLDAGADIEKGLYDGFTPLMVAALMGHTKIVDLFLDKVTDPEYLKQTASKERAEKFCAENNIEIEEENIALFGKSAADIAKKVGHTAIAEKIKTKIRRLEKRDCCDFSTRIRDEVRFCGIF